MKLKPETPIYAKLQIKRLEDECESLKTWIWRMTITVELLLIVALAACVANFYAITLGSEQT